MDQETRDRRWGMYNRRLATCIANDDYVTYRDVRYKMVIQLIYEKRYLDAFRMLSSVFLYDLNGTETPYVSEDVVQIAQNLYKRILDYQSQMEKILMDFLWNSYTPYHFYPINDASNMFLLFVSGNKDQANEIFQKYLPNAHDWLQKTSTLLQKQIKEQDKQLRNVITAETHYKESGNLEKYVEYWESIWADGGPKFFGMKWWFVLPDLYFKQKRFDDVIDFCEMVKILDEYTIDKANKYIQRAKDRKEKADRKRI